MAPNIGPSNQAEAKSVQSDETVVMAGSALPEQPQATVKADGRLSLTRNDTVPKSVPQQALPPLTTQASNLFQSVVAFVGDGCGIVDDEQYRQRLEICHKCDRLSGNRCAACGCFINVKARGRIFRCPLGRW